MMRHRYLLMIAVVVLGATACAGPDQDLEVEVQGRLADLDLSEAHSAALTLPLPPYIPGPDAAEGAPEGWVVNPDIAEAPKPAPTGSKACPFTDPRQAVQSAVDSPTRPPAEASYRFFAEGLYEAVSADGGENAAMPDETARSVENVNWGPGQTYYDFDMVVEAAHGVTTTRYRVVLDDPNIVRPDVPRPVNVREPPPPFLAPSTEPPIVGSVRVGTPAQPGMYVLSVQSGNTAGGDPLVFNDGAGMLLVRWPALEGDSFHAQATVGDQQISYTSTITDDSEVEACGTLLDSKAVNIGATVVPLDGDDPAVTVDATYNIATQYGGVVVADTRTTTVGNDATSSTKETVTARITQEPKPPGDPAAVHTCPRVAEGAQVVAAGATIDTPPMEATYRMTVPPTGEPVSVYQIAGLDTDAGKLPGTLIRTVQNVEWGPGREYFEYETTDNLGGSITTTKYRVVPAAADSEAPSAKPEVGSPGMYLVSTTHPDGEVVEYNDGAGMLMVPFPFAPEPDPKGAAKYTMVGSDGVNDVVVAVYVEPNEVVTACGTLVEGWRVDVVIDPGKKPGKRPEVTEYVDTRLLPPEEPPVPEDEPPLPEPPRPPAAESGPRSQLELMRPYTDYLHDEGHIRASYSFTIAPALGGLPVTFRSSMTSLERADVFGQSLVYTMSSKPEVPR